MQNPELVTLIRCIHLHFVSGRREEKGSKSSRDRDRERGGGGLAWGKVRNTQVGPKSYSDNGTNERKPVGRILGKRYEWREVRVGDSTGCEAEGCTARSGDLS
jgi:hypothetical protein